MLWEGGDDDDDIYILMKCVYVCVRFFPHSNFFRWCFCLSVSYVLSSLSQGVPSELIAGDVMQIVEKTHKCTSHPNCIKTIDCRP